MVAQMDDILRQAVRDKIALRLSTIGSKTTHNAKALQSSDTPGAEGLWVHLPEEGELTVDRLGTSLPEISVSFGINQSRYAFESKVLARNRRFWLNDSMMFDALLIAAPVGVRKLDERRHPRFPVSQGSGVSAMLIRLDKARAQAAPLPTQGLVPVEGTLQDLSLVGAGFICTPDRAVLNAPVGERLACVLEYKGAKTVLTCSVARVTSVSTRAMRVGVDFAAHGNERGMPGKLAELAKVVAELERQDALRRR